MAILALQSASCISTDSKSITKSKTTESVEVPPHSHTTQATNATIANANRQEAKTKQKRTKKRDQLDFE
jgi:microcystin-dependent protein